MGALAATGRKRRGFKEGGPKYGKMTARGFVNSTVLPSRVHVFSDPFVLTGGVDLDMRGIKKNIEPSGALRRTTVHHDPEPAWGESSRIVLGEN